MAHLLFALLHLLALLFAVRLTLPERYLLTNPYAAAANRLVAKMLGWLRAAMPFLGDRALCAVALALTLSAAAASLPFQGGPTVVLGGMAVATFPARGFLGWLGVEALRFTGFLVALWAGVWLLRLWHLRRPLPGVTGDLARLAARPVSALPLWAQGVAACGAAAAWVGVALACAGQVTYPLAEVPQVREAFAAAGLDNPLDLAALPPAARVIALAFLTVTDVIGDLRGFVFILIVLSLVFAFLGSPASRFFLNDAIRLFNGALPRLTLGPIDFTPLAALLALGLAEALAGMAALLLARGLAHVV